MNFTMNPTSTELVALRRSVRNRRVVVWIVVAVSLGLSALIKTRALEGWLFAAVWGIAAIISVAVWRCPRCGQILRRNLPARECSHCHLQFDGDQAT